MHPFPLSEVVLIEEMMASSAGLKEAARGFSIGQMVKMIRTHLKMSQKALAARAGIPQPTISRIEQGKQNANLSTLKKMLDALSCDLVIAPLLRESIEGIRKKQAKKIAEKRVQYLAGTMNLEKQQPDSLFLKELLKKEMEQLLSGPGTNLWED